jgi:hypothetical protein
VAEGRVHIAGPRRRVVLVVGASAAVLGREAEKVAVPVHPAPTTAPPRRRPPAPAPAPADPTPPRRWKQRRPSLGAAGPRR